MCDAWALRRRHELLSRPSALWAHLDIDFAEEAYSSHQSAAPPVPSLPADGGGAAGPSFSSTATVSASLAALSPAVTIAPLLRLQGES